MFFGVDEIEVERPENPNTSGTV
jgi:hypothetical protein